MQLHAGCSKSTTLARQLGYLVNLDRLFQNCLGCIFPGGVSTDTTVWAAVIKLRQNNQHSNYEMHWVELLHMYIIKLFLSRPLNITRMHKINALLNNLHRQA